MRGRSSDRSARSRSVHRSTGRPVGSPQRLVAAQSLVENVRLAALCGLVRCEIAEDPKGNRRRRSMRRMPRELASGSSEKWRRPVSTGVSIPGSGPAADHDDMPKDRPSQYSVRTILRTESAVVAENSRATAVSTCGRRYSLVVHIYRGHGQGRHGASKSDLVPIAQLQSADGKKLGCRRGSAASRPSPADIGGQGYSARSTTPRLTNRCMPTASNAKRVAVVCALLTCS